MSQNKASAATSSVNAAKSGSSVSLEGMAERFQRLQDRKAANAAIDPDNSTDLKITFGKHTGSRFSDIYNNEPGYVKWCCSHLTSAPNTNQAAFRVYIAMRMAEEEKTILAEQAASASTTAAQSPQEEQLTTEERFTHIENTLGGITSRLAALELVLAQIME